MRMNSETILRRRPSERIERFQRTSWDLLSKAVSPVCLAVVITSRTVAACRFEKLRPISRINLICRYSGFWQSHCNNSLA